jgi:hypothetical protein
MDRLGDHDGKSKSASAVDVKHYPHPGENAISPASPTHAEIAARAHELWIEQGRPPDSAERIWFEAERELKGLTGSRSLIDQVYNQSGSVQP